VWRYCSVWEGGVESVDRFGKVQSEGSARLGRCRGSRSVWFRVRCLILTVGGGRSLVSDLGFG
jgi:hypothetical protein